MATLGLAAEVGIDAMTIDDVALRAGVAKGTVYYNVRDKDDLVRLSFVIGLANVVAAMDRETSDRTLGPDARFEALLRTLVGAVAAAPGTAQLLFAEAWRTGRPWYSDLVAGRRAIEERIGEVVADVLALRTDGRDPRLLATGILAMVVATTLDRIAEEGMADEDVSRHALMLTRVFRDLGARVGG